MRWNHPLLMLVVGGSMALVAGCSSNNDNGTKPGFGTVRISMTDAPAAVDSVNIVVREVSVHRAGSGDNEGWYTVREDSAATYDLLLLQNGVFVTLGEERLPAGSYDRVRVKLGEGSTVVVDGVSHPLTVPSGMQSGIKLNGPFTIPINGTVDLALDFNASRSLHQTGNGTWMLNPVIRVVVLSRAGAIVGRVDPAADATVYALVGGDTLSSATTISDGHFKLAVLPQGTYSVRIDVASGYRDTTFTGVSVAAGDTTQLGTITLTPQ